MEDLEEYCKYSGTKEVVIADTTAFLAALQLQAYKYIIITTPSVLSEVKDLESRARLDIALAIGRVKPLSPTKDYVKKVLSTSIKIGEHGSLSRTDIEVAALALQIKEESSCSVRVVTDDYALQNLLYHLGIKVQSLRTRGIKNKRRYVYICPACGYKSYSPSQKTCPYCGTPLVKKKIS